MCPLEELAHGLTTFIAIVERELVHVHRDEAVATSVVEAPSEAERVVERIAAVVERGIDRRAQDLRDRPHRIRAEIAADGVHAEWERQPGLEQPPLAEVEALLEPGIGIRELTFVDQETDARAAGHDLVQDLVERY